MNSSPSELAVRFDAPHSDRLRGLAATFRLLADETRLRVLSLLRQNGEINVRSLCEYLSQSQPAVSHHLALLRDAGLIRARRDGKHNYYRCVPGTLEAITSIEWPEVLLPAEGVPAAESTAESASRPERPSAP